MKVLKRDGREKDFDIQRIYKAITYAFDDVYMHNYDVNELEKAKSKITEYFNSIESSSDVIEIEVIQDIIVDILKDIDINVSIAYEEYREQRTIERDKKSYLDIEIDNVIRGVSEESTANGNVDGNKIQSIRAIITNIVCRDYSRRHYIPKKFKKKHKKSIYIHDEYYFGLPFFNCCIADWENMFDGGFDLGTTHINPPKSLSTAVNVLTQVASHISSNTYGGTTFGGLVTGLCPYGKKSLYKWRVIGNKYIKDKDEAEKFAWDMFTKEAKDCAQSIEYEIQTLMTSRGETPFLTLGINVINPNATPEEQEIQRIIATSILNQRLKGLDDITPVFPKLIYQLLNGNNLNPEDPNYDLFKLAVKTSARRSYPDYTMTKKVIEVTGSYKEAMGCRSFAGLYLDENGNEVNAGRFNWGVFSINIVRLAIQSGGDEKRFYKLVDEALQDIYDLTIIKFNILKKIKAKQAPILYMSGAIARLNAEDTIESLLLDGYSSVSVGYVGLSNCLAALYGEGLENQNYDIVAKGSEIMQYIRNWCDTKKKETRIGFSMYGTPAETLATKFCEEDVKDFGIIKGVNDQGYYENSFHYPSNHEISPFDKLDLESKLNYISSGGVISFVELGDMNKNLDALEDVIRYAYDKTPFLGISTISDHCLKCGYTGEIKSVDEEGFEFECPVCKNKDKMTLSIIRKLCGYLGSVFERATAKGKMLEIKHRVDNRI